MRLTPKAKEHLTAYIQNESLDIQHWIKTHEHQEYMTATWLSVKDGQLIALRKLALECHLDIKGLTDVSYEQIRHGGS